VAYADPDGHHDPKTVVTGDQIAVYVTWAFELLE